jgi:carbamate kinase
VTPAQLIDWGPARCHDADTGEVAHEGLVVATTVDRVLVRNDQNEQRWFPAVQCEAVGADMAERPTGGDS